MSSIAQKAMVVTLSISRIGATKKDKEVTSEIVEKYNTDKNAGNFNKRIFSKEALQDINDLASKARGLHSELTLPWNDDGARLLASKNYDRYNQNMVEISERFNSAVKVFIAEYQNHIEDAKSRLGDMFNPYDYPDVDEIKSKFDFKFVYNPVPQSRDFRIDVSAEELQTIQDQLEKDINAKHKHAIKSAWINVDGLLKRLVDRLEDPDKIVRSRVVDSIKEMIPILESFNFDDDPVFSTIIGSIESKICTTTSKELNDDVMKCMSVAKDAKDIIGKISDYVDMFND